MPTYVGFERGLQSSLNSIIQSITTQATQDRLTVGHFYLTSDTNRLYVCKEVAGSTIENGDPSRQYKYLVELNQSITFVPNMQALPTGTTGSPSIGQFYYVESGNILCVYTQNGGWVQINGDTTLNGTTTNISVATATGGTNGTNSGVRVSDIVRDSAGNESKGEFTIIGQDAISVSKGSGNEIILSVPVGANTTYTLGGASTADGASITLSDNDVPSNVQSLEIVGDGNTTSVAYQAGTGSNPGKLVINGPQEAAVTTASFNSSGLLSIRTVVDGGQATAGTITPQIKYGKTADATPVLYGTTAVFANGDANLDIYTTGQVDALINSKMQAADAMTYKGVASQATDITGLTSANKGDTYKAGDDFILNGEQVKSGDLIIYNGPDTTTTPNISYWDIVPSGNDQVITITASPSTGVAGNPPNALIIKDNNAPIGSIQINEVASGSLLDIVSTAGSNNSLSFTINQKAAYTAQHVTGTASNVTHVEGSTAEFEAITEIETDVYGNVKDGSIKKTKITVTDTHANLTSLAHTTTNAGDKTVQVGTRVQDSDNSSVSDTFTITSPNLEISAGTKQVNISLVWESFDPVTP